MKDRRLNRASEIVQFWYKTKERLLAIIIVEFLRKILFNRQFCEWICRPSVYLYRYMIAQFLSVKQTECSYVN